MARVNCGAGAGGKGQISSSRITVLSFKVPNPSFKVMIASVKVVIPSFNFDLRTLLEV